MLVLNFFKDRDVCGNEQKKRQPKMIAALNLSNQNEIIR
jgi:hypothetical protein